MVRSWTNDSRPFESFESRLHSHCNFANIYIYIIHARTLVWTLGAHQACCVETEEMCCVESVRIYYIVWTLGAHQARCVETEEMCCVEFVRAQTSLPPQTGASALTLHTAPVYSSTIQLPIQLPHTALPYSSISTTVHCKILKIIISIYDSVENTCLLNYIKVWMIQATLYDIVKQAIFSTLS
jgi:hypothetical protein